MAAAWRRPGRGVRAGGARSTWGYAGARGVKAAIRECAAGLGFIACGVTHLGDSARGEALDRWLAAGYGGTMRYLHRQARKRKRPALIDERACTAIVVLDNYFTDDPALDAPPKVARYARGADYHTTLLERLEQLAAFLREHGALHTRCYTDAGPVPERELAERAGLGWIGKNAMLIRPGAGSWTFIGTVLTDLALPPDAPFVTDHCGSCTRCLDACPTQAFAAPRVLDATRCLSYVTIEQKGPVPDELRAHMEGWAFGCDICNAVCPWNVRFAETTAIAEYRPGPHLAELTAARIEAMDEGEYARVFGRTPLGRPGRDGMLRNLRAIRPAGAPAPGEAPGDTSEMHDC